MRKARSASLRAALFRALSPLVVPLVLAATPASSTTVDEGEVVVDPDGNLLIGIDGYGKRTVDAMQDGPHSSITLGMNETSFGEYLLTNGASGSTPGILTVGVEGESALTLLSGSTLQSNVAIVSAGIEAFAAGRHEKTEAGRSLGPNRRPLFEIATKRGEGRSAVAAIRE